MKLCIPLALGLAVALGADSEKASSDQPQSDVQPRNGFLGPVGPGVYPGTGYPGTGYPGTGYPGTGYPGTGYPGTGYPGTGYPGTGYPGTGYPGTGYPGTGYPGTGYPGTGYPGGNPYVRPSGCKNWCRRDNYQGFGRERYFCCDRSGPDVFRPGPPFHGRNNGYPGTRQKVCPPPQPVCLRAYGQASPPTECYSHSECSTTDGCCYDTCLRHKVCKTADYVDSGPVPVPFGGGRGGLGKGHGRGGKGGGLFGLIGLLARDATHDSPSAVAADEGAGADGNVRFSDEKGKQLSDAPGSGVETA